MTALLELGEEFLGNCGNSDAKIERNLAAQCNRLWQRAILVWEGERRKMGETFVSLSGFNKEELRKRLKGDYLGVEGLR